MKMIDNPKLKLELRKQVEQPQFFHELDEDESYSPVVTEPFQNISTYFYYSCCHYCNLHHYSHEKTRHHVVCLL